MRTSDQKMASPVQAIDYRKLYQQLIYIEDQNLINIMKMGYQIQTKGDETGILAYAYIDEEHGICFNAFSLVKEEDGQIIEFNDEPMNKKINHRIKLEDLKEAKGFPVELDPDIAMNYVDRAVEINKIHASNPALEEIRLNPQIDGFRHKIHPDDVECFIFDPSTNQSESFWARTQEQTTNSIRAIVLTPISKKYSFAIGDRIELNLYNYKDSVRLIHIFNH